MEKRLMKQLDQLKSLQSALKTLETQEVRDYLECKRMIDALRSEVRKDVCSQLILKPNGFGIPRTFKPWSEINLIDAHITKDRKQVRGILKGDKELADILISHRTPPVSRPSAQFKINGWVA